MVSVSAIFGIRHANEPVLGFSIPQSISINDLHLYKIIANGVVQYKL